MAEFPEDVVAAVRDMVARRGVRCLEVSDLQEDDLDGLAWVGGPLHLQHVAQELQKAARGEVDYLAVRSPSGVPVAKGGVNYAHPRGPGMLWQLATYPALQGLGIGTLLINALEDRILWRGLDVAWLGVEVSNTRALSLYRRLGYRRYDKVRDGWDQQDEDGRIYRYETDLVLMRKPLRAGPDRPDGR